MKRLSILSTLAAFLVVVATGCLKDKGFNSQNYGIQVQEVKAVSFPQAAASPLGYGLDVSATPQVVSGLITVAAEIQGTAETDLTVTITNTTGTALSGDIAAYNAAHGTNVQILPTALYSVPGTVIIPAGQRIGAADITVLNTTSLDPNSSYGLAFTITSAPNGYQIAENQKKVVIIFSVKNRYDGIYQMKGYGYLGNTNTNAPFLFSVGCNYGLTLETTGPNTVRVSDQPLYRGGATFGGFCNVLFDFTFDLTTNKITNVTSWSACPPNLGISVTYPTQWAPPAAANPPAGIVGYNSRYDPATKTIYMATNINTAASGWTIVDTLVYCGPR